MNSLPQVLSGSSESLRDAVKSLQDAVSKRVIRVTSIAAMEACSAPVGYVFSLNAGGRSGVFDVVAGDFSTELAADTLNGIYVGLSDNPTATTKVLKRRISLSMYSIDWFSSSSLKQSVESCWGMIPEGGTMYVPPGNHTIDAAIILPSKGVNIKADGSFIVTDRSITAFTLNGAEQILHTLPGTDFSAISEGDFKLNKTVTGIDTKNCYVLLESTEDLVNRVGLALYQPYKKIESHGFIDTLWMLSDPILYDYNNLSELTVTLVNKTKPCNIDGLNIKYSDDASGSEGGLLFLQYVSNVTFNNLVIEGPDDEAGIGVQLRRCHSLRFVKPIIYGYNEVTTTGGSYKLLNSINSFISFTEWNTDNFDADVPGSDHVARHGNFIYFNNCKLKGVDDHFGSNYTIENSILEACSFAGKNLKLENIDVHRSSRTFFSMRSDTPYCKGELIIRDVRFHRDNFAGRGQYFIYANRASDPLNRNTPFKFFDSVIVENIRFTGSLPANEFVFISAANGSPAAELTYRVVFNNWTFDLQSPVTDFVKLRECRFRMLEINKMFSLNLPSSGFFISANSVGGKNFLNRVVFNDCNNMSFDIANADTIEARNTDFSGQGVSVILDQKRTFLKLKGCSFSAPIIVTRENLDDLFLFCENSTFNASTGNSTPAFCKLKISLNNLAFLNAEIPSVFSSGDLKYYFDPSAFKDS
jgi:hypothetical protein